MQVTLTKIFDKTRQSARTGKDFVSRSIKTNEHGEKWISGFKGKENEGWREGDTVEITIEERGEYLNFSVPKATYQKGGTNGDMNRVEAKIDRVLASLATIGGEITSMKGVIGSLIKEQGPDYDDEPHD